MIAKCTEVAKLYNELAAKDEKIAELEAMMGPERLRSRMLGVVDGFAAGKSDAENSLRAVSEALKEKLKTCEADADFGEGWYLYNVVDATALDERDARLRAIVEGK